LKNKKKIINDPVYGFIQIPNELIFDLIEHPYFQRLRRIRQLGLSYLVYPGAHHTRFHHALGAMHLMSKAVEILENKGVEISEAEKEAVLVAILLHDIGHGPFSHVLEHSIIEGIKHEEVSLSFMETLNEEFSGKLSMAIDIFKNRYHRKFLHELVSSQLDMDRLDYLSRDSFYTGVSEGIVGTERIIQMLNVAEDSIVIDEKGVYSVEKFIVARRLMYWQVYLHKTTLAADEILISILKRARYLSEKGEMLFATPSLSYFLKHHIKELNKDVLMHYNRIDDNDIITSIKVWMDHEDRILSMLCQSLIHRKLPNIQIQRNEFDAGHISSLKEKLIKQSGFSSEETAYLVRTGSVSNEAYRENMDKIIIRSKSGQLTDIAEFSDNYNISALKTEVRRYYLVSPRGI
jgi:HD superfamily phosphohydrolase